MSATPGTATTLGAGGIDGLGGESQRRHGLTTRTALPAGAGWLWLDLLMPTALIVGLLTLREGEYLGELIIAWSIFLTLRLVYEKHQRPLSVFWGSFTVYSTSAWIAATQFNERFPPFPRVEIITAGTIRSLEAIALGFIVVRLVLLVVPFKTWWRGEMAAIGTLAKKMSRGRLAIASLILLVIAAIDWYQLLSLGLGNVLGGRRRQFATALLSASNHNIWVLAIAATLALALHAIASGPRSRAAFMAYAVLALYWVPSVLAGSRQFLVAIGVSVAVVVMAGNVLPSRTVARLRILAGVGLICLFLLPFLETGQLSQATIEFVYPQYMLFSAMAFSLPLHMSYLRDAAFMLPSGLRPIHVQVIGDQFKELNITNVGIGDHPVGEAYIDSPHYAVLLAVAATLTVLMLVVLLSRVSPAFLAVGVGLLAVWGRSDFWVVIFYIVYGGLLLAFFLYSPARAHARTRVHPP